MRMWTTTMGLALLALAAPAAAQPPAAPAWLSAPLPPGWQRIDEYTLRRVDIANTAERWQRLDANRWHLLAPGEAPRAVASR